VPMRLTSYGSDKRKELPSQSRFAFLCDPFVLERNREVRRTVRQCDSLPGLFSPRSSLPTVTYDRALEVAIGPKGTTLTERAESASGNSPLNSRLEWLPTRTFASFSSPAVTVIYSPTPQDRSRI
jgi:hypothetical protein